MADHDPDHDPDHAPGHAEARRKLVEQLREWNSEPEPEPVDLAEVDRAVAEIEARNAAAAGGPDPATTARLERIERLLAELTKPPPPPPVTRSTLSASEKSSIIRSKGIAYYRRLPWQ